MRRPVSPATSRLVLAGGRQRRGPGLRRPRTAARALSRWALALCLLVFLAGFVAVFQLPASYSIDVGTGRDRAYLDGLHDPETAADQGYDFRWTRGESEYRFQGVGQRPYQLSLRLAGWRPAGELPPLVAVLAGGQTVGSLTTGVDQQIYTLSIPAETVTDGNLTVTLQTPTFIPGRDARNLGVNVDWLRLDPALDPSAWVTPAWGLAASTIVAMVFLYLLALAAGWRGAGAAAPAAVVGTISLWGLSSERLWTALALPRLPLAVAAGLVLAVAVRWAGPPLYRRAGIALARGETTVLSAAMGLALAVRLAGEFHPQIRIMDLIFHLHRLEFVLGGNLYVPVQSMEFGGNFIVYPPAAYLLMLPLLPLTGDRLDAIRLFTALVDTLAVLPLYYLARQVRGNGSGALLAVVLYLALPLAVLPFSWGITANLTGQALTLWALAGAIHLSRRPRSPAALAVTFAAAILAFLSHVGAALLLASGLGTLVVLAWAGGKEGKRRWSTTLALLTLGAGAAAAVLYYREMIPVVLAETAKLGAEQAALNQAEFTRQVGGSVRDESLGLFQYEVHSRSALLLEGARGFVAEIKAYYRAWPAVAAALGWLLLWRRRGSRAVWLAATAWLVVSAFYALIGLWENVYVRYALFAFPIISLLAGLLLGRLWARGLMARVATLALLAWLLWTGGALWYERIAFAFQ